MTQPDTRPARPLERPLDAPLDRKGWLIAGVMIAAALMDMLDGSIVNVALPRIQTELGASSTAIRWVVSGYMLAFAATLIIAGRLGDRYGRRRLFLAGVVGFGVASLCSGLAQNADQLVLARVAQGAMAALLTPQVLATLRTQFAGRDRAAVFGLYGAASGLAVAAGVILGGALTQLDLFGLGWRTVFLVNVPVAIVIVLVAVRVVPESHGDDEERMDVVGALVLAAALVAIVYPMIEGQRLGWPWWCFVTIGLGVTALGVLGATERRRQSRGVAPLLQARLFRVPAFSAGLAVQLMFGIGMQGFSLVLILWLQLGHHFEPLHAGLTLVGFTVGAVLTAPFAGTMALAHGRRVLILGALMMAGGTAWVGLLVRHTGGHVGTWPLEPAFLVSGAGLGFLVVPLVNVTLAAVPAKVAGGASGLFSTAQQLGGALGVAIVGSVFFARLAAAPAGTAAFDDAFRVAVDAVVIAFVGCAALCLLLPRTAVTEDEAIEIG